LHPHRRTFPFLHKLFHFSSHYRPQRQPSPFFPFVDGFGTFVDWRRSFLPNDQLSHFAMYQIATQTLALSPPSFPKITILGTRQPYFLRRTCFSVRVCVPQLFRGISPLLFPARGWGGLSFPALYLLSGLLVLFSPPFFPQRMTSLARRVFPLPVPGVSPPRKDQNGRSPPLSPSRRTQKKNPSRPPPFSCPATGKLSPFFSSDDPIGATFLFHGHFFRSSCEVTRPFFSLSSSPHDAPRTTFPNLPPHSYRKL